MRLLEGFKKFVHYPGVSVLGGLLLGAAVIGVLVLIAIYVLQPALSPETRGLVRYQYGKIIVWYPNDLPASTGFDPRTLAATINDELSQLTAYLQVNPGAIPNSINVFVHPSVSEMRRSIALRKSPTARASYTAPLDLLVGENPRSRLAELVLAFGWGNCTSALIKTGMSLYMTQPHRNFYAVVAALPDRLFLTIPQLAEESFPASVYDQFDSPYSPAAIASMEAFRNLLDLTPGMEEKSTPALEAAALIQYLIDHYGGINAIRKIWQPGLTSYLLTELTGKSLTALSIDWRNTADNQGRHAPDYERWHIYYLLASGAPDSAYTAALTWYKTGNIVNEDDLMLIARCALVTGDITTASAISRRLKGTDRTQLGEYIMLYAGWKAVTKSGVRVIAPDAATARAGVDRVYATYEHIEKLLDLTPAELPPRLTVFLYPDAAALTTGRNLTPFPAYQCAVIHLVDFDDVATWMAEVLPAYAWNALTYSRTLRMGMSAALTQPEQVLIAQGCQLRSEGKWVPLGVVDVGTVATEVVRIEGGLMVDYLLHRFGPVALRRLWVITSPRDRYLPLDSAISEVYGMTRDQIGSAIVASFLKCS